MCFGFIFKLCCISTENDTREKLMKDEDEEEIHCGGEGENGHRVVILVDCPKCKEKRNERRDLRPEKH